VTSTSENTSLALIGEIRSLSLVIKSSECVVVAWEGGASYKYKEGVEHYLKPLNLQGRN